MKDKPVYLIIPCYGISYAQAFFDKKVAKARLTCKACRLVKYVPAGEKKRCKK